MAKIYRLGTRASELAQTQSNQVAQLLRRQGLQVQLVLVKTSGDVTSGSLAKSGGTGLFAAALRQALEKRECDLAVHSYKDLPTAPWPNLVVAACPQRVASSDVLCGAEGMNLEQLPKHSRIGTGSPRRAAQLKYLRPDLITVDIRGNVGTRLGRVRGLVEGGGSDLEGVILAQAGLERLGKTHFISQIFTPQQMVPAPAQGVLAVEVRESDLDAGSKFFDPDLAHALTQINHLPSFWAAQCEQAVLAKLGAGCAAPVGAFATWQGNELSLRAVALSADGGKRLESERKCQVDLETAKAAAHNLGVQVAQDLLDQGAEDITDLHATKPTARTGESTHDEVALWAPGISGATDPRADVKVKDYPCN